MKPVGTFMVVPALPDPIKGLRDLAYNLRWAWNYEAIELFRRLDRDLWETSRHNPVLMLGTADQSKLEAAAADPGFLAHLARCQQELQTYLEDRSTWFRRNHGDFQSPQIAYFSAEFGVTECLSVFAGGLGVLAGDHLKSASDLDVPLVGVGLLYQQGYFKQYLNEAGWQQESYENNDFHNLPLVLQRSRNGDPLTVQVPHPGRQVHAQIWRAQVGRIPLYLLDTNIAANRPEDRVITDQLYGGDVEMRIRQEMVLGIGGYRALEAIGIPPVVCHMNEGHAAFLALERIARLMTENQLTFAEAREAAAPGLVFTTHTPVPAGHDCFPDDLMSRYFGETMNALGLSRHEFLALGRGDPNNDGERYCMTVLALRLAGRSNGVSRLHGKVSRQMWQHLWPSIPEENIPISYITNGVHIKSWISREMTQLFDRYLGPRWREEPSDRTVWQPINHISPQELWRVHEERRERLVNFCRHRLAQQLARRGASPVAVEAADEALDPGILTIGFARRFATYKRATLILQDEERLARILNNPDRPVQIIFAGKAHPRDEFGKQLIQKIVTLARQARFRSRIVFLENYDMAVARYLVQGADVWLNTPLRLQEASGTSGMKAAANGVLNLSILDGWWDEAYQPEVGWAIGRNEVYSDPSYQNQVEAEALYELLEREIVPEFYERGADRVPRRWVAGMKACLLSLSSCFNTHRMVGEYTHVCYLPGVAQYQALSANQFARAKTLAAWKSRVTGAWNQVRAEYVHREVRDEVRVGSPITFRARLRLGTLQTSDVTVELCLGCLNANGEITDAEAVRMQPISEVGEGCYLYEATSVVCRRSGEFGFTVRVLPNHRDLVTPILPGLVAWA